ncbi:DMT family transporter [Adhaeribacter pallidiroseus]|uniref:Putative transporter YcbK n=1 Tax=Adhaeribacter pallidiroseus TaxID=2072847 RepID=A0A369QNT5_9BACT|nr:DMT family transporter [Adhaeribacter pallidiroseus]RDC63878.1 putative transporter YcbK [Adhaeribacter pallidiroseus]
MKTPLTLNKPVKTKLDSKQLAGALIVLLGAVCFSSKAVIVKLAYQYHIDSVSLLALRMLFSLPFFLLIAFFSRHKEVPAVPVSVKNYLLLAFYGLMGYYLASLFDFMGLQYITAGLERLILFVYPTLVVVFSRVFLGKKITQSQYLALALTYSGVLLVLLGDVEVQNSKHLLKGGLLVFASAVTYALYLMGSGILIPRFGSVRFNSYAMSVAALGVFSHYLINHGGAQLLNYAPAVYGYSVLMAIVATVVPSYLIAEGIRLVGAGNAAIIGSVGPISTILLAFLFLGETVSLVQLIGTGVVLSGILLITIKKEKLVKS